ncbi:hypothetical protein KK083_31095 [Fulvivirgaceae bacterium PWU4]|uniref:Uncharacterized protein n=1 Tax=Chryseosolibacter histidini TaxID=2782349 RepID=A0AAP2DRW2_9BACT|nr:hypothetical protein [Chryseosolibacter histidini]MBT1701381.1 hypothetical protein [Chryseosolibacter histidini]
MTFLDSSLNTFTVFTGMLCLVAYAIIKGDRSNLGDGATAFLGGNGIASGSYLCLVSFTKLVCENPGLEQNRPYVFIGGAAVLWLSVASLRAKLKNAHIVS